MTVENKETLKDLGKRFCMGMYKQIKNNFAVLSVLAAMSYQFSCYAGRTVFVFVDKVNKTAAQAEQTEAKLAAYKVDQQVVDDKQDLKIKESNERVDRLLLAKNP